MWNSGRHFQTSWKDYVVQSFSQMQKVQEGQRLRFEHRVTHTTHTSSTVWNQVISWSCHHFLTHGPQAFAREAFSVDPQFLRIPWASCSPKQVSIKLQLRLLTYNVGLIAYGAVLILHSLLVCVCVYCPQRRNPPELRVWRGGGMERQCSLIFWAWTAVPIFNACDNATYHSFTYFQLISGTITSYCMERSSNEPQRHLTISKLDAFIAKHLLTLKNFVFVAPPTPNHC